MGTGPPRLNFGTPHGIGMPQTYSDVANHELDDGCDENHVEIHEGIHRDAKHVATRENGGNAASDANVVC